MKMKVYNDPHFTGPIKVGYRGISTWTHELNEEFRAKLAALDYETLSDEHKAGYNRYKEYIEKWDSGINPLEEKGFFYCPYIPLELQSKQSHYRLEQKNNTQDSQDDNSQPDSEGSRYNF